MIDVDDTLRSVMRSYEHLIIERIVYDGWLRQIRGPFFRSGDYIGGAVLGAKADWTTAMCEGRVEFDHGILIAKSMERDRKVQLLVDVAAEWGIDLREELRCNDD